MMRGFSLPYWMADVGTVFTLALTLLAVVAFWVVYSNHLTLVNIHPVLASSRGMNAKLIQTLFTVAIAVVVTLVISSVGLDAFWNVGSEVEGGCALTLASGQQHMEGATPETPGTPNGIGVTETDKSWSGHTWKSITLQ